MRVFAIICWLMVLFVQAEAATTYYVAMDGNDAWSGTLVTPNVQRTDGPFATLARARDAVRAAKGKGNPGPFVVEVRGGFYSLSATLMFTPQDSGTEEAPTIYRAYRGERPIISGGRIITGFNWTTLNGVRCWSVELPGVKAGWYFGQLFVKRRGQLHFQRRYRPTKGMLVVAGLTYSPPRKAMAHRAAQQDFRFFKGDFQAWENLSDVEVVALHSWSASRLYIENLDISRGIVRFTSVPTFRIGYWYPYGRNPYYIENIKELLHNPGEWYLDRPTGVLYYVPMPGETPANVTVVAPRLKKLIVIAGDQEKKRFVEHLSFEGIAFCHAAWVPPRKGYDVSQGQPTLPAAVEFRWAKRCTLHRCSVAHTGAYGVSMGIGCHENRIAGCLLYDLGGGGVKVGDSRMDRNAVYPILPTDNVVENNVIAGGGLINFSANGVWAGIVKGLVIRHNEIRDFPYSGIAVGWCWGYAATSCADNKIMYNHIHHVMKLIQDGGGIYTLGQQPGTVIRGNVIHDCLQSPFACSFGQLGIYLDEGSGPFVIEDNIVYNVQMGAFNQHYGRDNLVQNNIFAFTVQDPITCAREETHLSYTFRHNIVYLAGQDMMSKRYDPARCNTVFDNNIYYSTSGKEPLFAGRRFKEWQATGRDRHSIIANPRFVAPTRFDFRLKPDSPALKIGFKALDASQAGLEAAYRDVDVPSLHITPPPVYAMKMPVLPPIKPGFRIDCEDVPLGLCPHEFIRAGCKKNKGDFVVTSEAAMSGKKSLKGYEKGGLTKSFYPYLIYNMRGHKVEKGKVSFSFAFRNSKETPARVVVEIRDYANRGNREYLTGPVVFFAENGKITAGSTPVATVPNGEWCHVAISFTLGVNAAKTFHVTVTTANGTRRTVTLPFVHETFATATWLGIVSAGTKPAAFYLDDLVLEID